jgi:energy-coupling factor transporter ATP-binding protein EcfA2
MGLVVELCGLPGSGKSTLAAHIYAALREAGVEAVVADLPVSAAAPAPARVRRKVLAASAAVVREPVAAARVVGAVTGSRPTPRDGLGLAAQWLTVRGLQRSARARAGVSLLEEGVVQTLWSLALRAPADGAASTRMLHAWSPDLLVVVDAPLDVLMSRLESRPSRHSRTQRIALDRRGPELERGRLLLDLLVDTVPCGRITVPNDGSVPIEQLGRHVAEWVLRVG